MQLTREQALNEHRKMWNWIADETKKRGYKVSKEEYLYKKCGFDEIIYNDCFCCEYALFASLKEEKPICSVCPIDWGTYKKGKHITCLSSLYGKWYDTEDPIEAAQFARQIASLPRRTDNIPKKER